MEALLIIDMQKDFCYENGALYIGEGVKKIMKPLKTVLEFARGKMKIIYTMDWHREDDSEFDIWPKHCVEHSEGAEIVDELTPPIEDYIIRKRKYSAFFGTDLDIILREAKVEKIFVTGVATNICVLHTVGDAVLRNYRVDVIKDCTAAIDQNSSDYGIQHMKNILNANIITSKEFTTR